MDKARFMKQIVLIFSIVLLASSLLTASKSEAFTSQVIQRGATGEDVVELQARHQYNGFYNGKIDGVYGWGTYWAVRNFQNQFGMKKVDGLVGQKTKNLLVQKTKYYKEFVQKQLQQVTSLPIMAESLLISKQRLPAQRSSQKRQLKVQKKIKKVKVDHLGSLAISQATSRGIKHRNKQQPTCLVVFLVMTFSSCRKLFTVKQEVSRMKDRWPSLPSS